jgi:apolipoprotein N-acyltransferase
VNWFSLAQPVILAWGWRRALIAFLAGAASTLALAPINVWPAMFVTFPLLVWLLDGAAVSRSAGIGAGFAIGWWFGFGYFFAGLYWVGHAFLVDARTFGWLMPSPSPCCLPDLPCSPVWAWRWRGCCGQPGRSGS